MTARIRDVDRGYKRLMTTMAELGRARVTVGVHADQGSATHAAAPHGGKATPEPVTVVQVAIWNEFGMGVPERSFLRGWFDGNLQQNQRTIAVMAKSALAGKRTARDAIEIVGQRFVGELQRWIADGSHVAPNAPATIRIKGSSTPLVDTGQLRTSITYLVTS